MAKARRSGDAGLGDAGTADHWRGAPTPSGPPPETPAADGPEPRDGGWPEGEGPAGPVPDWMAQVPPAAHDGRRDHHRPRQRARTLSSRGSSTVIDGGVNDVGAETGAVTAP